MSPEDIIQSFSVQKHTVLLKESYERVCGQPFPIKASGISLGEALYTSSMVLVSHGMEEDPVFNYANLSAQALWGLDWGKFTRLPSRLSAKEDKVEKREDALKQALSKGFISGYEGIRIDAHGREFYIRQVTIWNVLDEEGVRHGQAALFDHWEYL